MSLELLFAQREFIEALQEFSENFQRSNESDWSVPGGYNCMLPGFTVCIFLPTLFYKNHRNILLQ